MKKIMKKAQDGLRTGQYKRLGRIDEKNPARAERVAGRMTERASRVSRGKEIAGDGDKSARNWALQSLGESRMEAKSKTDSDRKKYDLDESNKKQFPKLMKQKSGGKTKMKAGGMLKRADGSYSKRGLWDNIRANKGSGKKPTAAMLKQEKKIKAKTK